MFPVGMRIVVDANDQVDRLRGRVVDRYCERRHTRPIGRRFGGPNYQLRPFGQLEIDSCGGAAGIDAGPCDPGKTRARDRDVRGFGRVPDTKSSSQD